MTHISIILFLLFYSLYELVFFKNNWFECYNKLVFYFYGAAIKTGVLLFAILDNFLRKFVILCVDLLAMLTYIMAALIGGRMNIVTNEQHDLIDGELTARYSSIIIILSHIYCTKIDFTFVLTVQSIQYLYIFLQVLYTIHAQYTHDILYV